MRRSWQVEPAARVNAWYVRLTTARHARNHHQRSKNTGVEATRCFIPRRCGAVLGSLRHLARPYRAVRSLVRIGERESRRPENIHLEQSSTSPQGGDRGVQMVVATT